MNDQQILDAYEQIFFTTKIIMEVMSVNSTVFEGDLREIYGMPYGNIDRPSAGLDLGENVIKILNAKYLYNVLKDTVAAGGTLKNTQSIIENINNLTRTIQYIVDNYLREYLEMIVHDTIYSNRFDDDRVRVRNYMGDEGIDDEPINILLRDGYRGLDDWIRMRHP